MLLHDTMDDAVADVTIDLAFLAAASRRQGLSMRRRRRGLAMVGAAVAATLVVVATRAVLPDDGGPEGKVATDTIAAAVTGPLSGETAPITNRGVAAALAAAVDEVADGTFTQFHGAVYSDEALAGLLFLPTTGTGPAGEVMINLQPLNTVGGPPYTCDADYMTDCTVRTLTGGDVLRTYRDDGDSEFGADSQRVIAELLSPHRRLRVIVFAFNTNPSDRGAYRDRTVLDTDQLSQIARRPWWSRTELPREYVDAGEQLEDFN